MKESKVWFITSQVWLVGGVVAPEGWQAMACVLIGVAWFCGSLALDRRELKHG